MATPSSVRVAVRLRPLTDQDPTSPQGNIVCCVPHRPQVIVDRDRSFTFDHVFPSMTTQPQVYDACVAPLLNKFLDGYNATIFAYGQTGSGKTYSMGTVLQPPTDADSEGMLPRFIKDLFSRLGDVQTNPTYDVCVSFLELYNEDIIDLLGFPKGRHPLPSIMEDGQGNIRWHGVREESVSSPQELIHLLHKGLTKRTTASTDMNHTSSRSHAIFSVSLKQYLGLDPDQAIASGTSSSPTDREGLCKTVASKFHFVDLAGSERLKRTNAVGDRAKESISINTGLLALGNVISALGDESRRALHVPYRDSKLTRMLQDSLGGNSHTLMLACISAAACNLAETLDTLKYANRARNIRNRVKVNQGIDDSHNKYRAHIAQLKEELRINDEFLKAVNNEMDTLRAEKLALLNGLKEMTEERNRWKARASDTHGSDRVPIGLRTEEAADPTTPPTSSSSSAGASLLVPPNEGADSSAAGPVAGAAGHDRKKKRYSIRLNGYKRTIKSRHRLSVSCHFGAMSPKSLARTTYQPTVSTRSLEQHKAELHKEEQQLKAIKSTITLREEQRAQGPLSPATSPTDERPALLFANSIADDDDGQQDLDPATLQSRAKTAPDLLEPFPVESLVHLLDKSLHHKYELLWLAEKAEKAKASLCLQHDAKMTELDTKRSNDTSLHKKEVSKIEARSRKQAAELKTLREKCTQLTEQTTLTQSQHETALRCLQKKLDDSRLDKKRLMKRMQQERTHRQQNENGPTTHPLAPQPSSTHSVSTAIKRKTTEDPTQVTKAVSLLKRAIAKDTIDRPLILRAIASLSVATSSSASDTNEDSKEIPGLIDRIRQSVMSCALRHTPVQEIQTLRDKLHKLRQEQQQLCDERQVMTDATLPEPPNAPRVPQYMDERIDVITAEIGFLSTQIDLLKRQPNDTTTTTTTTTTTATPMSVFRALRPSLRQLGLPRLVLLIEGLVEDMILLKAGQQTSNTFIAHMDFALQKLHRGLIQMRYCAQTHTLEDVDTICLRALLGDAQPFNGLLLPASTCSNTMDSTSPSRAPSLSTSSSLQVYPAMVKS